MLATQRNHQLLVRLLLAPLVQHAHVRLAAIERLAGFAEAAREAIVDQRELEDALQGVEHAHLRTAAGAGGVGGDFDFGGGGGGGGGGGLFSVRLGEGGLAGGWGLGLGVGGRGGGVKDEGWRGKGEGTILTGYLACRCSCVGVSSKSAWRFGKECGW